MNRPKIERNRELILKRKKDPKKWTFRALAKHYGLKSSTVHEIWEREQYKF